ncbi:MAG: hypothetical protein LJE87_05565, partial [Deltaproteobacteria bacterium]|nr:hypothetical protein [Deltaproteobacteria bacterium]
IEVKNIVLFVSRTSTVSAEGGFDIVLRTPTLRVGSQFRYSKYKKGHEGKRNPTTAPGCE